MVSDTSRGLSRGGDSQFVFLLFRMIDDIAEAAFLLVGPEVAEARLENVEPLGAGTDDMAHGDAGAGFLVVVQRLRPEFHELHGFVLIDQRQAAVHQVDQIGVLVERGGIGEDRSAVPEQDRFRQRLDLDHRGSRRDRGCASVNRIVDEL